MKQNPAERLGQRERDEIKWVKLERNCDQPERNFARIRTTKPKLPDVVEQAPAEDADKDGKQDV